MEASKKIIRDDVNFLEYPNWVIGDKKIRHTWTVCKERGKYEITCPFGLPKHFDKIVLYCLLYKLHRENDLGEYKLVTNRYEIAKSIFGGNQFSKNVYDRLLKSLRRWQSISINFEGVFYEGDGYTIRGFSIIEEFVLRKDSGELTIRFNEAYVKQIEETKFYKLIDFEQYKKLHKASSARLYEVLCKTFQDRKEWAINIQLLAEKLTFEKSAGAQNYYPSDVLRYLKPAINEINKKTELEIDFQYNKETAVCVFKKVVKKASVSKEKDKFNPATRVDAQSSKKSTQTKDNFVQQVSLCIEYFEKLPKEEQDAITDGIQNDKMTFLDKNMRIYLHMKSNNLWQP